MKYMCDNCEWQGPQAGLKIPTLSNHALARICPHCQQTVYPIIKFAPDMPDVRPMAFAKLVMDQINNPTQIKIVVQRGMVVACYSTDAKLDIEVLDCDGDESQEVIDRADALETNSKFTNLL